MELTSERLRELFEYSPDTGIFTFRVSRGRRRAGSVAGNLQKDGYMAIGVDSRHYLSHRLAWLYVNGSWPVDRIDHADGDRSNNRIANLRDVSHSENLRNQGFRADNTSGFKGVSFHKATHRWKAQIHIGGKSCHIGLYDTQEDAHAAYARTAADLGYSSRHIYGEAS